MPLSKRLYWHKTNYLKHRGKGNFVTSFKILECGIDYCDIVLVEEYPCENKMKLLKRERYYIENNNCINRNIPSCTDKEWREANKNTLQRKAKEYRQAHKTKIGKQLKEYNQRVQYTFYCPCGGKVKVIRQREISRHKETIKHRSFEQDLLKLRSMNDIYKKSMLKMCGQISELFASFIV